MRSHQVFQFLPEHLMDNLHRNCGQVKVCLDDFLQERTTIIVSNRVKGSLHNAGLEQQHEDNIWQVGIGLYLPEQQSNLFGLQPVNIVDKDNQRALKLAKSSL